MDEIVQTAYTSGLLTGFLLGGTFSLVVCLWLYPHKT